MRNFSMAKEAPDDGGRGPYKASEEDLARLGTGGIKLRQWRHFRHYEVRALAEKAGVATGTISGIENAKVGWGYETLFALANALEIPPEVLLGINPYDDEEFWSTWIRANPDQRRRIGDFALGLVGVSPP